MPNEDAAMKPSSEKESGTENDNIQHDRLTLAQLESFELEEEEHSTLELAQLAEVLDAQGHLDEAEDLFQTSHDRYVLL